MLKLKVGQKVGHYQLIGMVKVGRMSTIYKACHLKLDKVVALKVLHPEYFKNRNVLSRLELQATPTVRLKHPHIISVQDMGQEGDLHYIVLDFIHGQSLTTYLKLKSPLPYRPAEKMIAQLALALDYSHQQGVVHCAITPAHILIDSFDNAYLTDFGLVTALHKKHLLFVSDPIYVAPEQASGAQTIDPRSDLYSLGVVFYEMLTGQVPFFEPQAPFATALKHMTVAAPSLKARIPGVPQRLERVILKLLAKDPRQRFQTGQELYEALQAEVLVEPVATPEPGPEAVPPPLAPSAPQAAPFSPVAKPADDPLYEALKEQIDAFIASEVAAIKKENGGHGPLPETDGQLLSAFSKAAQAIRIKEPLPETEPPAIPVPSPKPPEAPRPQPPSPEPQPAAEPLPDPDEGLPPRPVHSTQGTFDVSQKSPDDAFRLSEKKRIRTFSFLMGASLVILALLLVFILQLSQRERQLKAMHYFGLGNQAEAPDQAIQYFQKTLALEPALQEAQYNLGIAYLRKGDYAQALQNFSQLLPNRNEDSSVHYAQGIAYERQGQLEEAMQAYNQALKYRSGYVDAHFALGNIYKRKGQNELALQHFQLTIVHDPKRLEAYNNLGALYLLQGKLPDAIRNLQTALELKPDFTEAQYNLALSYEKTNRSQAIAAWVKYLALAEKDPRQQKLIPAVQKRLYSLRR